MTRRSILAVGTSSLRMGFVYFAEGDLRDWGMSRNASLGQNTAFLQARSWIRRYHPHIVLVEYMDAGSRKGEHTKALAEAVIKAAQKQDAAWERVVRPHIAENKDQAAAFLAEKYPAIAPWLPKTRLLLAREHENMIYFEALLIADRWIEREGDEQSW